MKRTWFILVMLFLLVFICCNIGHAPVSQPRICEVETSLSHTLFFEYTDSLSSAGLIPTIPDSLSYWQYEAISIKENFSFMKSRVYFFEDNPVEMYFVVSQSELNILLYFNSKEEWISGDGISELEKNRIRSRFEEEYVKLIESYR
jgi:hypothetical protein